MKKRRVLQIAFAMILIAAGILFGGRSLIASGLDTSEVGDASDIGHFEDRVGGYSHVGIKVYWEDQLECYALDTYKKNERGIWQYLMSNINGHKEIADSYRGSESPFWLKNPDFDRAGRFLMRGNLVKKGRTDYSVYVELYLNGKLDWTVMRWRMSIWGMVLFTVEAVLLNWIICRLAGMMRRGCPLSIMYMIRGLLNQMATNCHWMPMAGRWKRPEKHIIEGKGFI